MISVPVAILAGGLATRLRPITATIPKSLVTVAGKPFLAHQIDYLRDQGVSRVVLCVGYLGEMIRDQFGDGRDLGIEIDYSFDGPVLLGTGGAIKQALPLLGESFFVMYGDSYLPIDFKDVLQSFHQAGKPALMTVFPNFGKWEVSNVWFEGGTIRKYSKKDRSSMMQYVDYGLSVFNAGVFQDIEAGAAYDLADLLTSLSDANALAGYVAPERFYEIGSLSGLEELNSYLKQSNAS
jgi:NDP-sugar pyrophosphorylase family protein